MLATVKCERAVFLCVSGGIPAVVQSLNSESSTLREAATLALSNLTHNNKLNTL